MSAMFGWAVLYPVGRGFRSPGMPSIETISGTRDGAMEKFADRWRTMDEAADHHSIVWQRAYRRGWRLARVEVRPLRFGASQ